MDYLHKIKVIKLDYLTNPLKIKKFVKISDKKYKINTDFRVAIKCNELAQDESIIDYERPLAIIYMLFGDAGLVADDSYDELLKLALKYLALGKELEETKEEDIDMDMVQDIDYIETSFMSDYQIDLALMEIL